jgi:two-component system, NtrC family, sensor histidine kinase HydH
LLTIEQALRHIRLKKERKELERRTHVAEKLAAIGTLTAGLSHEIRNPLNAAGLQLTVLERRIRQLPAPAQKGLAEPLSLARDEIRRLEHALEDFLQFATPRKFKGRPVDLIALLGRSFDSLASEAEQRGIHLERRFEDSPPVFGDEDQLKQVVMNLVLNSIDATPEGGHIEAAIHPDGDWVELTIEDSGSGIPEEIRHHIFEPFFTTKASGTGLGLSIVHAIIQQHDGTISMGSGSLGGAQFFIRLPRATHR